VKRTKNVCKRGMKKNVINNMSRNAYARH